MKTLTTLQQEYMDVANVFHFATRDHFALWFTGNTSRHKRTERILPALVKKGCLGSIMYGKRLIYATLDRMVIKASKGVRFALFPYHGLCCTEALVRFTCSDRHNEVISEKIFKSARLGSVPEWGIRYPNGNMLLFEFSTESNVHSRGNIANKIKGIRRAYLI